MHASLLGPVLILRCRYAFRYLPLNDCQVDLALYCLLTIIINHSSQNKILTLLNKKITLDVLGVELGGMFLTKEMAFICYKGDLLIKGLA